MSKILLIDDDEKIGARLANYFKTFDLELHASVHPDEGFERHQTDDFDLIILDIMMPGTDGMSLCKKIRELPYPKSEIPILMLSARGDVMDRVVGMEVGADDYLPKPFEPRELVVRVKSILKRSGRVSPCSQGKPANNRALKYKNIKVDLVSRQVFVGGEEVFLTDSEYHLLMLLAESNGKSFSRDEILNGLKGIDSELYSRAVDVLISRLRAKLKPSNCIKTVWGSGYCFVGGVAE